MEGGARCAAAGETSSHVDDIFKVAAILKKNVQRNSNQLTFRINKNYIQIKTLIPSN
jgi:hypothetical protein